MSSSEVKIGFWADLLNVAKTESGKKNQSQFARLRNPSNKIWEFLVSKVAL